MNHPDPRRLRRSRRCEPLARVCIERGYAQNTGGGSSDTSRIRIGLTRSCAEKREIHCIARDPRPRPVAGIALCKHAEANDNAAHAEHADDRWVITDADCAAQRARRDQLDETQTDAEQADELPQLPVVGRMVRRGGRCLVRVVPGVVVRGIVVFPIRFRSHGGTSSSESNVDG